jgi:hypothetical protein
MPVNPVTIGNIKQDHILGQLGKRQDSISKIIRAKRAGGVTKGLDHLPCSGKALSSNFFGTTKKRFKVVHINFSRLSMLLRLACL